MQDVLVAAPRHPSHRYEEALKNQLILRNRAIALIANDKFFLGTSRATMRKSLSSKLGISLLQVP